jgi:nucleoside diphosphate-linked moiety X motif 19, mitochondrial
MKMASSTIRKSASLIIASALDKSTLKNNAQNFFDYKIMLLKRPKQMKAFPDYHVFPGGKYDQLIDQSDEWLKVFLSEQQNELVKANPSKINECFRGLIRGNSLGKLIKTNTINNNNNLNIPLEISFRLCAIRETFEETGLLLAIPKQKLNSLTQLEAKTLANYYDSGECSSSSSFIKLNKWHEVIKQDSSKFIEMFFDLNLVPDVYGLHEWSNWITPAMEKIRFTTMFFTCFLPSQPAENVIKRTSSEIESLDV